jgi:signal transduction histidine kinase/CheY-like chemotaxis protein/HAMP domain-containing protein
MRDIVGANEMHRLSIARSLRFALLGLTLVLAAVAALGVSSLYNARQQYENTLTETSELSTAAANLPAAWLDVPASYRAAVGAATRLAARDLPSARLIAEQVAAVDAARALATSGRLIQASRPGGPLERARSLARSVEARQLARQTAARHKAGSDSRRAMILVAAAGLLALGAALALIAALVSSMRRPLDELVAATRELAAGQLDRRVDAGGPRELLELGRSFNAMGDALALAQQRIEGERQRLAVTIESLGDGLIVTEPDAVTIRALNPRATQLVPELRPGERIDGAPSPLPALERALAGETIVEHGGRTLAVVASQLSGGADGVVWTVRDMTERARLERAKSEFVATASHELRSPLTSIKGFVELLDRAPENMTPRQREFVEIILRSTDRLVELVNDLLDVARIEADRVEIDRREIDIGEAVREVSELMGPRIEEKRQQLTVHVAPAVPTAFADPSRVRQIIANLLTNAHLYTPEGGRIELRVEPDRAWVQILVRDSGVGMTPEQAEHVFERFYRVRASAGASAGTGLGLSIVRSLVELQSGQIEVESEPGRGTTFRVRLPVVRPRPESTRALDAIRGRRVLVVDDEREIAELIAGQLTPLEVQAEIATSGPDALARLRAEHFDAVTLDILMPEMDGFDVLREIRADVRLQALPIVFVSVFSDREDLLGEWVVSKPIDADELRHVLGTAVAAGRSRVLVVGREELRPLLEPALDELGVDHAWELTGAAAARVCSERRFEVALIDVGIRSPQSVLQALDLRGRRLRRAVIMFTDGATPAPPGISRLGMEIVPVERAAAALMAALRGEDGPVEHPEGYAELRGSGERDGA